MSKKKKGNGALQSVGNHNGAKASPLLGGMFSNAGVVQAAVPLASAEILMAKFDAEATPEQRAKVETELRDLITARIPEQEPEHGDVREHAAALGQRLDTGQLDAAAAVASRDPLVIVDGAAGAGKTTMLATAIHAAEQRGESVSFNHKLEVLNVP